MNSRLSLIQASPPRSTGLPDPDGAGAIPIPAPLSHRCPRGRGVGQLPQEIATSRPSNTAPIPSDHDASHIDRLFAVARWLSAGMARGDVITRPSLRDQTIQVFGVNDAGGARTMREASMPSKSRMPYLLDDDGIPGQAVNPEGALDTLIGRRPSAHPDLSVRAAGDAAANSRCRRRSDGWPPRPPA
jgi:hypothetical protein